jgi:FkbM family methyltransferase
MKTRNILYSYETLPQNARIAIYGSGKIGSGFKRYVEERREDLTITCFIDTFNSGKRDGINIIPLHELEGNLNLFDLIVVASSYWNQIEDELIKRRHNFTIICNELVYETLDIRALGPFRFSKEAYSITKERLDKVMTFFDDKNRYFFKLLMNLRLGDDEADFFNFLKTANEVFKVPYLDYIDKDFPGDIILEGGVSDATDSIHFYRFFNNKNLKIYGFEPFIEAFEASPNKVSVMEKGMEVLPWALWDKNENLIFNKNESSSSTSSVVRDNPNTAVSNHAVVKGVKVDSFIQEKGIQSVCLLKLDIEGAEMEALHGAKEMIKKYRPQLAISIYHKKEHLYEIPELLRGLHPGYEFKLGFYSPTFIDTVLYAIP